jgi:hypothetical protein
MAVEVFLVAMGSLATMFGFVMLTVGKLQRLPSLKSLLRTSLAWMWMPAQHRH